MFPATPHDPRKSGLLAAMGLTMVLALGCGESPNGNPATAQATPQKGLVAVVDLDAVANRTGLSGQLAGSVQNAQANLNAQLQKIQANLQSKLEEKKAELNTASKKERPQVERDLRVLQSKLQQILNATQREAQQKLTAHTKNVVANIRQTLRPIVEDVAKELGYDVVLTSNPEVIYVAMPQADITDAVVDRLVADAKQTPAAGTGAASAAPSAPAAAASPKAAAPETSASTPPQNEEGASSAEPEVRTIRVDAGADAEDGE